MSSQQKTGIAAQGLSEDAIAQYLQMHPDFFERHSSLLSTLRLADPESGPAVSLIERQVAVLRARNGKLERKLQELVTIVGSNTALAEKIHGLGEKLLATATANEAVTVLGKSLREDFSAEFVVLLIFDDAVATDTPAESDWVRRIDRREEGGEFHSLLGGATARCGRLTEAQRDFIFGSEDGQRVASATLTPLGNPAIGMLGIGSVNPDRFLPTMSVDFLSRVGGLVAQAIRHRSR
ncbi:MAG: DUF484 family protein [Pseudomonadota bacterium]